MVLTNGPLASVGEVGISGIFKGVLLERCRYPIP
jgi:hypothetical protein